MEVVDRYAERSGREISNVLFYYVFGLFKLAVIVQQIYYRYYHGQTRDKRFEAMIFAVTQLEQTARALESQSAQTEQLVGFSSDLINSVRVFKLPSLAEERSEEEIAAEEEAWLNESKAAEQGEASPEQLQNVV